MNYDDNCRTCLSRNSEMRHIHQSITIHGQDVRLSDILNDIYNYQVPDELEKPENICISCVHQLTLSHSFKSMIEESAKTLAANVQNVVDTSSDCNDYIDDDNDYKPELDYEEEDTDTKVLPKPTKVHKVRPGLNRNVLRKIMKISKTKTHTPPKKQVFCVECKAEYHSNSSLLEHCQNNHPPKNQTGRECQYCHERFDDFKDLVIHCKLHSKPYLCLTCWGGFYEESDYNAHTCQPNQKDRSKDVEKVLRQCDQCGKSYPPGYIKVHMMTHGTELKYSCKYCPKKFKVANGLNSHVLWNHKRTRNHKCEECGATFISASARSTHIRKNHLKEKKYGCENCSKRFFSKSELQRHMLTHTGVKDFHCHLCDKSYQTRYGLNVHLKSHAHMNINVLNM